MTQSKFLTRRELLRFGGMAGAGWMLSSVAGQRALAQGAIPKRVLFLLSHNGVMTSGWNPSGGSNSLSIGGVMSALNRHAGDMVAIDGMRYAHTGGHVGGSLTFLTNSPMRDQNDENTRAEYASLDYDISQFLRGRGHVGRNLLITTSAGPNQWGGGEFITYERPGTPIRAREGASALWDQTFSGYTPPAQNPPPTAAPDPRNDPDWRRRRREAVLGFVRDEYAALRGQLGGEDRARLEEIAESVHNLEQQIIQAEIAMGQQGGPGGRPSLTCDPGNNPGGGSLDVNVFSVMGRILVEALACEQTLVATLRFAHGTTDNGTHHSWHHGELSSDWENLHNIYMRWQADQVASLIDELANKRLGNGDRLLDHTLVVWSNEIGVGGIQEHSGNRLPLLLAGSMGGAIRTNQLIRVNGLEHCTLLTSIGRAFGMNLNGFGNMNGCTAGPLPGLST